MSHSEEVTEAQRWHTSLKEFAATFTYSLTVHTIRREHLNELTNWQARVSGGTLQTIVKDLVDGTISQAFYPALEWYPLEDRIFVFVTDLPGIAVAQRLLKPDSDIVISLQHDIWNAWSNASEYNADHALKHHYEYWNYWHQNFPDQLELPSEDGVEYWIHEERLELAELVGRGWQHLWKWNGSEMELLQQDIQSWIR